MKCGAALITGGNRALKQMNTLMRSAFVAALILPLAFGAGCGKKAAVVDADAEYSEPVQDNSLSASTLPGANEVIAALDKKEYQSAVGGLVRLGQNIRTPQQQEQYTILMDEVRLRLMDDAHDPRAVEALRALRRFTGGR
jgi:hypothetical protein